MRDEPVGLPKETVASALAGSWEIDVKSIEYAAVGAGSYHWRVVDWSGQGWFVTADHLPSVVIHEGSPDSVFSALDSAFQSAGTLRRQGLSFVISPRINRDGRFLVRVIPEWALAVFPLLADATSGSGAWNDPLHRQAAAVLIGRLHVASPPASLARFSFAVPHLDWLLGALGDLGQTWRTGPFAEASRKLLSVHAPGVLSMVRQYDLLAETSSHLSEPWVVTHGEPHSANFLSTSEGAMYLIDWDTVRLAPRERDLAILVVNDPAALNAYQQAAGVYPPNLDAVRLFQLRWTLADLSAFVRRLRQPHGDSEDEKSQWDKLNRTLSSFVTR